MAQHRDGEAAPEVRVSTIAPRIDDTTQKSFDAFYAQQERNTRRSSIKIAMLVIVPVVALGAGAVVALIILFS